MRLTIILVAVFALAACGTTQLDTTKTVTFPSKLEITFTEGTPTITGTAGGGTERELKMGDMGMSTKGGDGARNFVIFVSNQNDDSSQATSVEAQIKAAIEAALAAKGEANLTKNEETPPEVTE